MAFSGEKLRQIRLMRGLSQRDLPVAHDTVSRIESGRRSPHPSTLRKLADALGVEVRDFFEEAEEPNRLHRLLDVEGLDVSELLPLKDELAQERGRLRRPLPVGGLKNATPEEREAFDAYATVLENFGRVQDALDRVAGRQLAASSEGKEE